MRTATLLAAFAVAAAVVAAGGDGRMKHDFGALDGLATMVAPVAVLIRSSASVIPRLLDVARLPEGPYGGVIFLCNPASHGERCRCRGMRAVVPVAGSPGVRECQTALDRKGAATSALDKMCLLIEAFDSLCVPTCHPFLSGRPSRMQAIGLFHRRRLPGRRGSRAPPARQKPRGVPQDLQDRLRGSGPMPTAGLAPRGRREDNGTKTAMRERSRSWL
jgi:hypothetical protein